MRLNKDGKIIGVVIELIVVASYNGTVCVMIYGFNRLICYDIIARTYDILEGKMVNEDFKFFYHYPKIGKRHENERIQSLMD